MAILFLGLFFVTFFYDTRIGAGFLLIAIVMLYRGNVEKRVKKIREDERQAPQTAWKDPWQYTRPGAPQPDGK